MITYTRLPLEKAYNVRELGGYATNHGKVTAFRRFLRSDDITKLSRKDVELLREYGVRSIIDLRSERELQRAPNPFANKAGFTYLHQSLLPLESSMFQSLDSLEDLLSERDAILVDLYIYMLERSKNEIKAIFNWIARQNGCILFHCTAGKDRTGLLAMLLLGLVGVDEVDIVANYAVSEIYLAANPDVKMMNLPIDIPKDLLDSKPSYIKEAYQYVQKEYQSVENYLSSIGVESNVIKAIRDRLVPF